MKGDRAHFGSMEAIDFRDGAMLLRYKPLLLSVKALYVQLI
jgi:hypothetical protein